MTTDYTQPLTLIRLAHPARLSVVEFTYTPRYMKWTMLKYNPGEGQTASDAWTRYCGDPMFKPAKFEATTHGASDLSYHDIMLIVGHLALNGWHIRENRPYTGPSGYYECNAANAAEREEVVLF